MHASAALGMARQQAASVLGFGDAEPSPAHCQVRGARFG